VDTLHESTKCDNGVSLLPILRAIDAGDTFAAAITFRSLGVSTAPVKTDGSKEPAFVGWREYAERLPMLDELKRWYAQPNRHGIGITGGVASGNLAVFDFETWAAFARWGENLSAADRSHLVRCPVIGTPKGGAHVYVRLVEPGKGCKLARTADGTTLIEIRGSQHYVVAPGSPPACHPTRRPYRLLRPGWLDGEGYEPMPLSVWHHLTLLAVGLNEYRKPAPREVVGDRRVGEAAGDRPGDHFNTQVNWGDILTPHGWRVYCSTAGATYWTRPDKASGVSASTGFCQGLSGRDLLYIFSTSAAPFEAERSYSRFAAYAVLNHRSDYKSATRALALAGYGRTLPRVRLGRGVW
jgi:hypothetical protein